MSDAPTTFAGVVLCTVGDAGLAVRAQEVDAIAPEEPSAIDAALAYGVLRARSSEGRAVQCRGRLLRVDAVDVVATEGLQLLPVPFALARVADGAVTGFVEVRGALWPVVDVPQLVEHLARTEPLA